MEDNVDKGKPWYTVEWQKWWISERGKNGCHLGQHIEPIWLQVCKEDQTYGPLNLKLHLVDAFWQPDYKVVEYVHRHFYNPTRFEQLLSEMIADKRASKHRFGVAAFEEGLVAAEQLLMLIRDYIKRDNEARMIIEASKASK
jgi:hypothetical protein